MDQRIKHGHAVCRNGSPTYRSWQLMRQRCHNPRDHNFAKYGARGILVCERWRDSFANFFADMGERPPGTTLDRWPDREGNYDPGNCRWATPKQQSSNIATNVWIEIDGVRRTLPEWAYAAGIDVERVRQRLLRGWDARRAVTEIPRHYRISAGSRPGEGRC